MVFDLPYTDGRAAAYLEANGKVLGREFGDQGVRVTALVPPDAAGRLRQYALDEA